jgi:hypothetical protein
MGIMPGLTIKRWPIYALPTMADEKPKDSVSDYLAKLTELTKTLGENKEKREEFSKNLGLFAQTSSGFSPEILEAVRRALLQTDAQRLAAETNKVDNALANAWFANHWPQPRHCPVCRSNNWAMAPTFAHVPLGPVGKYQPVRTFPCVVVTCQTCGNTLFFNGVTMKLLPEGAE